MAQRENGTVTVTDSRMTRFWITLDQGVAFVLRSLEAMHGGEIFVPKIPSMNIMDLVEAIAPGCKVKDIKIRPGEKLHEALISPDEARQVVEFDDMFVVKPAHPWWDGDAWDGANGMGEGFAYTSDTNPDQLSVDALKEMIGQLELSQPA
jgi:FlaA1/EpsC-like NDP-sugar epimerase